MNFNVILQQQRRSQGLDIADAAEKVSLSIRAYQDLENGRADPNVPERFGLLIAFGMSHDEAMDAARAPSTFTFDSDGMERLEEIHRLNSEDPFVRETDDAFIIVNRSHDFHEYDIVKDEVRTPKHILDWVMHLSEKTWVSRRQIGEFLRMASKHLELAARR